jgi:hypothetical protein
VPLSIKFKVEDKQVNQFNKILMEGAEKQGWATQETAAYLPSMSMEMITTSFMNMVIFPWKLFETWSLVM